MRGPAVRSKYDPFWQHREEDLAKLLHEAYVNGRSELAVPELRAVGDRLRWAASVSVAAGKVLVAHGAHGKSLGHVLARLSRRYPDCFFRARISEDLFLWVQRAEREPEDSPSHANLPPPPREASPRHVTPVEDPDPVAEGDPAAVARRIHELIWQLPRFTGLPQRTALPAGGVYFSFERGEGSEDRPRIVRVGINTSGNLRDRLADHYRRTRRRSAFRRLIGDALLRRRGDPALWKVWIDRTGPELPEVEQEVSALLAERFSFACLAVDDPEERRRLETWLIACLARGRWPEPSAEWLGHHSSRPEVRQSGLWNIEGVDDHHCRDCSRWLARLAELVERCAGGRTGGENGGHGRS